MRRRLRLDDAARQVRIASLDLLAHLAFVRTCALAAELKYRVDQPRAPRGTSEGGQWVDDTVRVAARRTGPRCDGFASGCQNGGSFGVSGMFNIFGKRLCWDCTIKWLGIQDLSRDEQLDLIRRIDKTVGE